MAHSWHQTRIGDQVTLQRGFDITRANQCEGNVPVISSGGVSSFHNEAIVDGPGVVLGRKGVVGSVFYVKGAYWPHDTSLWVKNFHGNDPRFVYYFFRSIARTLSRLDVGSANPTLNRNHVHPIRVWWPTLDEQKRIAKILGDLDDKIELNRRMNATLEEMARALFKSWFIDFDPVRAKLDGRQPPNLPPATAALFPSSFEDSELGPIPRGWQVGKLGDIGTNPRRAVKPSEIDPDTPYIALEHMPRRCIALDDWCDASDAASGKSAFKKGEILFGKLRPYFHKVGIAPIDGVCSTDILVLASKRPEWSSFFLSHVNSDALVRFADLTSSGTKMPRTKWNDLASFEIAVPPTKLVVVFERAITSYVSEIQVNTFNSRSLARIRDCLLPELMANRMHW